MTEVMVDGKADILEELDPPVLNGVLLALSGQILGYSWTPWTMLLEKRVGLVKGDLLIVAPD